MLGHVILYLRFPNTKHVCEFYLFTHNSQICLL